MKTCSKCKIEKQESEFYRKGKEERLYSYCKSCFNSYCIERWKEKKKQAVEYKGGQCSICSYTKCIESLVFHHRNPDKKEYTWNKMRLFGWDKMKKELDKCDLLCANCHGEIHYQ